MLEKIVGHDQKTETKDVNQVQLVVFQLAGEEYGVEITDLQEIIKLNDVTPIPNAPDFIKGIIDLRGKIAMVLDLAKRFNLVRPENIGADSERMIIIAESQGEMYGLVVDSVTEVIKVPQDSLKETPTLVTKKIKTDYLKGVSVVNERLIILLDLNAILTDEKLTDSKDSLEITTNNL